VTKKHFKFQNEPFISWWLKFRVWRKGKCSSKSPRVSLAERSRSRERFEGLPEFQEDRWHKLDLNEKWPLLKYFEALGNEKSLRKPSQIQFLIFYDFLKLTNCLCKKNPAGRVSSGMQLVAGQGLLFVFKIL